MGDKTSFLKTLVVPAIISLALFVVLSYVLIPAYNRYRTRYSQYLPIESITATGSSLRERVITRIARFANRREERHMSADALSIDNRDEEIDDSEGEELGAVDARTRRMVASHGRADSADTPRLSRDLEAGFRDDSDDDEPRR
ncbi:uncharacterized protein F5Z01DRAFT_242102 [Emericellopsis atlantica]|uniref:Uncharacterized protein n=1 Tax=Emericellopsis atlantica TaxID=2614577 RepID=A0A9P8CMP1_9HYPO|nr:uncharacterized protein F5Z01DRAFT_242102 [Emericellopsis atlantica]KAG9252327.1 hypothetical protein F5Z01DRAFT_242102 [Emericellopsis atlantica]